MTAENRGPRESDTPSTPSATIRPKIAERLVVMHSCELFADLPEPECVDIASCALLKKFARNELLFVQGQPVNHLILLRSGSVKHTQVSHDGKEALLRMSGMSDVVNVHGEAACGHSCTARATEECEALVWEYSRIRSFLLRYPRLERNFGRLLVAQIQELEERFREVATEKVERRLALLLLRLCKQIGKPSDEGTKVSVTREELAQMTGATMFTISRALARWSEHGLILTRREAVVVTNPERLEIVKGQRGVFAGRRRDRIRPRVCQMECGIPLVHADGVSPVRSAYAVTTQPLYVSNHHP